MNSHYRVVYSESVRSALKDLCARAAQRGVEQNVLSALRLIDARLHAYPDIFGEPKVASQ